MIRYFSSDGNPATNEPETKVCNSFGDLDYSLDFNGAKVDPVYDYESGSTKLGRLAKTEYRDAGNALQATVTPVYDALGRVDTLAEVTLLGTRVTDNDYDGEGRVVKVTRPEGWVGYGYDEVTGRPTQLDTSLSQTKYEYDPMGRLTAVNEWKRNGGQRGHFTSLPSSSAGLGEPFQPRKISGRCKTGLTEARCKSQQSKHARDGNFVRGLVGNRFQFGSRHAANHRRTTLR